MAVAQPSQTVSDQDLLARLRAGEAAAQELLVKTYAGRLLALARRYVRNEADAEEVLQDAFLSAFKALPEFRGDSALSTWLHTITVRAALMKLRSRRFDDACYKTEGSIDDLLPKYSDGLDHRVNPGRAWTCSLEDAVARTEIRQLVRASIEKLPELYRVVLLMRDIDGFNTEETAQLLGLTTTVVKTRLHRARQALRTLLDPKLCDA